MGDGIRARRRSNSNFVWALYTISNGGMGTDTGDRVESKTMDYPVDGISGNYWYVLLRGKTTIYVWNIYNVYQQPNYVLETTTGNKIAFGGPSSTVWYASSYRLYSDQMQLVNALTSTYQNFNSWGSYYWSTSGETTITIYKGGSKTGSGNWVYVQNATSYRQVNEPIPQKGSATGKTAISAAGSMYPADAMVGNYWYVYSHSYYGYINQT